MGVRGKKRGVERLLDKSFMIYIHHQIYIYMVIKSRMRWAGNVTNVGKIGACRVLIGRWDGKKKLLGKPTRKWKDNIKTDLK